MLKYLWIIIIVVPYLIWSILSIHSLIKGCEKLDADIGSRWDSDLKNNRKVYNEIYQLFYVTEYSKAWIIVTELILLAGILTLAMVSFNSFIK